MRKLFATFQAIFTRLVFACHGIIAIWQVTVFKKDIQYWYLASPVALLFLEGIFTLTIKENQEWKWFCPSVFIYLGSVVPAIWLLELERVEQNVEANKNLTDFISGVLGQSVKLMDGNTWVTVIEQFLMLTLIVGRWLLPKGDLTRDQLSQLLLVYIGTAADIIEFFDSFKEKEISKEPLLVYLTLGIWSWSLLQFTVVLTATKSRKSRTTADTSTSDVVTPAACCCSVDSCAIVMNIVLQDAPFLAFRLLLITHYRVVSYMNIFFTCKNTLVILLQIYRLYVVHSEGRQAKKNLKHKGHKRKHGHKKHERDKDKDKKRDKKDKRDKRREPAISVISDPRREDRIERGKIRAIILTNGDSFKEVELSKLFKDQVSLEKVSEKKSKSRKQHKSESSGTHSANNANHTPTDDSGI